MSLYAGPRPRGGRLEGPERALDGVIGLVVLVVEILIGLLVIFALYEYALASDGTGSSNSGSLSFGVGLAIIGSGTIFFISTIVYLVRLARARRSWGAPLWGLILISLTCGLSYFIMSGVFD